MLQLVNHTPLAATIAVFPNRDAIDTLYVVLKATFDLSPRWRLSDEQVSPVLVDQYHGEPGASSLLYASELHVGKAGTDVVLVGQCHAPQPVAEAAVVVAAAERKKVVRVMGDRQWLPGGFSSPEPFLAMPLLFERAFGGAHAAAPDEPVLAEERNPVGVGFRGLRSSSDLHGTALPNLEDPRYALRSLGDRPPPACFAFTAPGWLPRRAFAGTYDEHWQRRRAPYLPLDFDGRFFNAASPELTFERFLQGGESIEVLGASPHGPVRFRVPQLALELAVQLPGRAEKPPLRLDTVLIEPDDNRVCLSLRAELPCDKQVLRVERITIDGAVPS